MYMWSTSRCLHTCCFLIPLLVHCIFCFNKIQYYVATDMIGYRESVGLLLCVLIIVFLFLYAYVHVFDRAFAWEARSRGFESHLRLSSFFLEKKGKWVVSGIVVLCCVVCHLHCLTTFLISSNIHV